MKIFFSQTARALMLVTAIIAWCGLALQQYILLANTPENGMTPLQAIGRFLIFFTVLSNILIAVCLTMLLVSPQSSLGRFFSRPSTLAATGVYILIVAVIYNVVLRPQFKTEGLSRVANEVLHVIVPILYLIFWLFLVPRANLKWMNIFYWLIYPGLYLLYALLRGHLSGFYAYPFINADKLGYDGVAINSIWVLAGFVAAGLLFIFIDRQKRFSNK